MKSIKFLLSIILMIGISFAGIAQDDWFDSMGTNNEHVEEMNTLWTLDHAGEIVEIEAVGHDDFTAKVLSEYTSGVDFEWEKSGRVAFMHVVGIKRKGETQHYLQKFVDSASGFITVENKYIRGKRALIKALKQEQKWKLGSRGQKLRDWFNLQFVPVKYSFAAYIGEGKNISKVVRDAPLYLAQTHLEAVDNGWTKHKATDIDNLE